MTQNEIEDALNNIVEQFGIAILVEQSNCRMRFSIVIENNNIE